ncbi:hypothetical protein BDM02DRAFT_3188246 [Thelephora ganbajun]|uniref:Uncharacterized protein n=1 Tax=Thelephora ganbajun TaxID=370292 RepID=A0ACB6ZC73_THEGA|nr:hypothetical protein BDM02DRAFT_3188246 [Thelephora ganbajun]
MAHAYNPDFSGFKVEDLAGEEINGEGNLFMLAPVAHKLYDRLELWFELQDSYGRSHKVKVADRYGNMLGDLGIVWLDPGVDRRWLEIHRSLCLISQDLSV